MEQIGNRSDFVQRLKLKKGPFFVARRFNGESKEKNWIFVCVWNIEERILYGTSKYMPNRAWYRHETMEYVYRSGRIVLVGTLPKACQPPIIVYRMSRAHWSDTFVAGAESLCRERTSSPISGTTA
jgi:hypothetical protein